MGSGAPECRNFGDVLSKKNSLGIKTVRQSPHTHLHESASSGIRTATDATSEVSRLHFGDRIGPQAVDRRAVRAFTLSIEVLIAH
jgi:hypothetical protein